MERISYLCGIRYPGIVGTLIAVSKLLDGVTDIFFGSLIDKTHSKMGKARPWMLYGYIGCAITLVAIFAIPTNLGQFAQYAWFLIAYTLLNAVFYTANNMAYSALTALITKNSAEQVEMGSYRFMFAFATSLLIQSITLGAVTALGGGAAGWRTVAGYMGSGNVPLMLLFTAVAALGQGPWQGDMNAVIAACSEYTWLTTGGSVTGAARCVLL